MTETTKWESLCVSLLFIQTQWKECSLGWCELTSALQVSSVTLTVTVLCHGTNLCYKSVLLMYCIKIVSKCISSCSVLPLKVLLSKLVMNRLKVHLCGNKKPHLSVTSFGSGVKNCLFEDNGRQPFTAEAKGCCQTWQALQFWEAVLCLLTPFSLVLYYIFFDRDVIILALIWFLDHFCLYNTFQLCFVFYCISGCGLDDWIFIFSLVHLYSWWFSLFIGLPHYHWVTQKWVPGPFTLARSIHLFWMCKCLINTITYW